MIDPRLLAIVVTIYLAVFFSAVAGFIFALWKLFGPFGVCI